MSTDRIEKKILLHAPRERIWRALSNSTEFGTWFGMKFDDPFVPGAVMRGVIVGTKVNAEVAKAQKEYEGFRARSPSSGSNPNGCSPSVGIPSPLSAASIILRSRPRLS